MTNAIIITICLLLLVSYIFDISSSKTKVPSVVLLLIMGWIVRQGADFFKISIPDLSSILPLLGTVGLILIVLEGSLELELNRSKLPFVGKTMVISFVPLLLFSLGLAWMFQYFEGVSFKLALANAIPFAVISSAIAIPSALNLMPKNRQFVTYESSMSDIFGVLLFNFITLNDYIGTKSVSKFFLELILILIVTIVATFSLSFLLSKIKHHVKFAPIFLMLLLIYAVSKVYHLPALLFILLFGLFLGNLDEMTHNRFIQKLHPEVLDKEVKKFKALTAEIAFLIRALFFLLFGYLIQTTELLNTETMIWALGIVGGIFLIRGIFLKLYSLPIRPLIFIAPRGLITILLFLSIPVAQTVAVANKSLIIQVIILTALVMMIGLMTNKKPTSKA
jgi:Kef-type K+ transport system membrane component KefB